MSDRSLADPAAPLELVLRGDHIALDALLKSLGLAASGGAAKALIAAGGVEVDGELETRRGRKLRAGQRVRVGDVSVTVMAPRPPTEAEAPVPRSAHQDRTGDGG